MKYKKLVIPLANFQVDGVSDGHYSFGQLYEQRDNIWMSLMLAYPHKAFVSKFRSDGSGVEGHFFAGIETAYGQVGFWLPADEWDNLSGVRGVQVLDRAPPGGDLSHAEMVDRLRQVVILGIDG